MQKTKLLRIKNWIKKNNAVDAIIFGSSIRGSIKPKDVDICLIIPDSMEKESLEIFDSFSKSFKDEKFHVTVMTEQDFISGNQTLVKTLILEGFSVMKSESISKSYGFESKTFFTYSLNHLSSSERVRIHYALRGRRGSKGVLSDIKGNMIGKGVITVPIGKEDEMRTFMDSWKIKFSTDRALMG